MMLNTVKPVLKTTQEHTALGKKDQPHFVPRQIQKKTDLLFIYL